MYPNGQAVYDPLVLLELGEMRCGHVNRVGADLFRSNGWPVRLVQVAHHVLAEVWYDDRWHYFDADIFGNGETVSLPDRRIPSFAELSEDPGQLDALTAFWEPDHTNTICAGRPYPSWFYFGSEAYRASGVTPAYIEKRATPELEAQSRQFGWEYYEVVPDAARRLLPGAGPKRTPGAARVIDVRCRTQWDERRVEIEWKADEAAAGYRVFAASTTRGWNYDGPSLPQPLMHWKSARTGWRSEMYDARYRLPGSDLGSIETRVPGIILSLPARGPVYITVMPFDHYGESVGRRLYPVSEELLIP